MTTGSGGQGRRAEADGPRGGRGGRPGWPPRGLAALQSGMLCHICDRWYDTNALHVMQAGLQRMVELGGRIIHRCCRLAGGRRIGRMQGLGFACLVQHA
jgi:hypothetical protein